MTSGGRKSGDGVGDDTMAAPTTPVVPATKVSVGGNDVSVDATMAAGSTGSSTGGAAVVRGGDYLDLTPVDPKHYLVGKEIAKGGMGRILAARDRRLGRPVAIKELLVRGGDFRQRFEREARITARLQHPAIVNLLEAGTWPSGEPFYAMKLVAGRSLDDVIRATTTLDARLALLPNVIAVVDALAYAHSQRVIHRDLKPANVLVGDFGETVVIDWGLAKDLADTSNSLPDLAAGPFRATPPAEGQTVAGSVMGTPAYMPAEQARGATVDERADVYALGAILYHVLAGAPPYTGNSADEILDKVIAGPPAPLLGAPPDLVTIVNKAMAHDAAARYPSAQELAVDLKKFQTGQLVGAHRYSAWQLAGRWIRRNKAAVTVASALLAVLAVTSTIGVRRIMQERDVARTERAVAEQNRLLAEERKTHADTRRMAAEKLVEFMVFELRKKLEQVGKLDALAGVGSAVVDYYDSVDAVGDTDIAALTKRQEAIDLLGDVELAKGDFVAAERLYRAALDLAERLVRAEPGNPEFQRSLSVAHDKIGDVEMARGNRDLALASYRHALDLIERLCAMDPTQNAWQRQRAIGHTKIATISEQAGRMDEALLSWETALNIYRTLAERQPHEHQPRRELALVCNRVASIQQQLRRLDDAAQTNAESLRILEQMLTVEPTDADLLDTLGEAMMTRGMIEWSRKDLDAAKLSMTDARRIRASLAARDPDNVQYAVGIFSTTTAFAELEIARKDHEAAILLFREARAVAATLVTRDGSHVPWLSLLASSQSRIGDVELSLGRAKAAIDAYATARDIYTRIVQLDPSQATYRKTLRTVSTKLGNVQLRDRKPGEALDSYRNGLAIREELLAANPDDADAQRLVAQSHEKIGDASSALGRRDDALTSYRQALAMRTAIAAKTSDVVIDEVAVARCQARVAGTLGPDDVAQARTLLDASIATLERLERAGKLDADQKKLVMEIKAQRRRAG